MSQNIHPADAFGLLKAELAKLEEQTDAVRSQLIALGVDKIEGDLFRVSVSHTQRESVDWKAIAAVLLEKFKNANAGGWQTKLVTAHTTTKPVTTVRCVARIGKAA